MLSFCICRKRSLWKTLKKRYETNMTHETLWALFTIFLFFSLLSLFKKIVMNLLLLHSADSFDCSLYMSGVSFWPLKWKNESWEDVAGACKHGNEMKGREKEGSTNVQEMPIDCDSIAPNNILPGSHTLRNQGQVLGISEICNFLKWVKRNNLNLRQQDVFCLYLNHFDWRDIYPHWCCSVIKISCSGADVFSSV